MKIKTRFIAFIIIFPFILTSPVLALPADINESNRVDGFDLILFSRVKGATPESPNWLQEADINNDKIIDEKDLSFFAVHFARKGVVSSLWVSDYNNNKIVRLSGKTGKELLRTGGFLNPYSMAVNPLDGSCWICDYGNNRIIKLDAGGRELLKITGFNKPQSIAYNWRDGSCWVGEYDKVAKLSSNGEVLFRASGFLNPASLDIDLLDGSCWIADYDHNQAVKLNANGLELVRKGGFNKPVSVSVNQGDGSCWIADKYNNQVVRLISTGTTELVRIGGFNRPNFISVNWQDESIWIADYENNQVARLDKNGAELARTSGFIHPVSVSADPFDYGCWVADYERNQVVKLSPNGKEVMRLAGFNRPKWVSLVPEEIKPDGPYVNVSANKNRIDTGEVVDLNVSGVDSNGYIQKYEIDFEGDGVFDTSLDTAGSISHVYESLGIYNAVVKGTDDSFLQKYDNEIIRIGKLVVKAAADTTSGNAPLKVNFSAVLFDPTDGRVENYQWDFDGDGIFDYLSTTSGAISYIYQNVKTYKATVKVTDTDGATAIDSVIVTVSGSAPKAKASANPGQGVIPLTVNLSASGTSDPDGFITLYQWDFNRDGIFDWNSVLSGDASWTYLEKGTYNPGLKVTDNSGLSDSSYCTVIVNQSPPKAQASANPASGNAPLNVNFNGTGSDIDGNIVKYEWDFGDGNTWNSDSSGITSYIYDSPGVYNAVFKATDNEGGYATASIVINVFPPGKPYASASASPDSGPVPLNVSFTGTGLDPDGQIVRYEWDFGDGNSLSLNTTGVANHTYDSLGNYTALFKITDNDGLYSTANILIKAQSKPVGFIQANTIQGNAPLEISFKYFGTDPDGTIKNYELDFEGDDTFDFFSTTAVNVSHIYQNGGAYNPVLKVTDNDGYFNTTSLNIACNRTFPVVKLTACPQKGNSPLPVVFRAEASDQDGFINLYEWDFNGDDVYDTSSAFDSLVYVYDSAGDYKSKVRVTDNDGGQAVSLTSIRVNPAGSPSAQIYVSPQAGNIPLEVYFGGTGTDLDGWITQYEFDFNGDGIYETAFNSLAVYDSVQNTYESPGIYEPRLRVTDNDGLTDMDVAKIFVSSASVWIAVSDPNSYNGQVIKLEADGKELKRLSGFKGPYTVSVNVTDGSCWIADCLNDQVVKVNSAGQELFRINVTRPSWRGTGISVNANGGSCWVAAELEHKIIKVSSDGQELFRIGGFYFPHAVSVNSSNGSSWVTDTYNSQIVQLSPDGVELKRISGFNRPKSVSVNPADGSCWISNTNSGQVVKLDSTGQELFRIGGFNIYLVDLVVNPEDGNCWVADTYNNRIVRFDANGKGILSVPGFIWPEAICPDVDGGYWVADSYTGEIVKISANGTTLFRKGGFWKPMSVAFDPGTTGSSLPLATALITPLSGDKPLPVNFGASAIDTTASIINYEWDFEGDGIFDFSAPTESEANTFHTYSSAGVYNPILRVTNSNGLPGYDYKNIVRIGPAKIDISQDKTGGPVPLDVSFSVSAFNPAGLISKYEWDFNGDGIYDWNSLTTGNINWAYSQSGIYQPVIKITDEYGTEFVKWASQVTVDLSGPVPVLNVSPTNGTRPLNVLFKMWGSYDYDGSITLYELDYNDDNVYDWNSKIPVEVGYIYNSAGTYFPTLKTMDNDGLFSTVKVTVTVNPVPLTVTAEASPVKGKPPLNVSFSGTANSDYPAALYEWDFDGDGVYDRVSDTSASADYTYNTSGNYNAVFKASDSGGRYATAYINISVLPSGNPEASASASRTSGDTPLKVDFAGIGTDSDGTIVLHEWDFDGNGSYDWNSGTTGIASWTYNNVGSYNAVFRITDNSGLTDTAKIFVFAGVTPKALPQAYPGTGFAPLNVTFTSNGSDEDGVIYNYEWDFDGNGTYDGYTILPDKISYTYKIPGTYQAKLRVTDNDNLKGEEFVTINVQAVSIPTVSAQASPAQGAVPLTVSFSGSASDSDGTIKRFEWDFDGNGLFDWISDSSAAVSYTYETVGIYSACLKGTDNDNNFNTSSVLINATSGPATEITAGANPSSGTAPLKIFFNVTAVDTASSIARYEWDFDGDGVFDWLSDTTGNTSSTYTLANDYTAMLRVTNSNNVSVLKSIPITVNMGITTTLSSEAFDPVLGETIAVNSILAQPAKITLRIVDRNQNPVKTIISNVSRDTGFYSDTWNGRDDSGNLVKTGIYFFVIDYEINGKTYSYNLTNTSGNYEVPLFSYPVSFSPYDGKICTLQYTLDKPAEITLYVFWAPSAYPQYKIKTICMREPQKSGTYIAVWDGTNSEGITAPPGSYVLSAVKWPLAKNAIIINGRPVISDIAMSTGYFSPGLNPEIEQDKKLIMQFRLSKQANIKVKILDGMQRIIVQKEFQGMNSGLNNINWTGRDENGFLCGSGKYTLGIRAIDAAGNESNWMYGAVEVFY
ncbi:MAG: PKD domain-containing protein [bacterium]